MRIALALSVLLLSLSAQAHEESHTLGALIGTGSMHNDYEFEDKDYTINSGIFYQYHFSPKYSLTATYLRGATSWCIVTCDSSDTVRLFHYNMEQLGFKRNFSVSKRWSLFAEVTANEYHTTFTGQDSGYGIYNLPKRKNSGINAAEAVGIEFNARNGLQVGFRFQYAPMKHVDIQTYNAFVGFSF